MKTVCKEVYANFPGHDLTPKKDFIKATVKSVSTEESSHISYSLSIYLTILYFHPSADRHVNTVAGIQSPAEWI